MERVGMNGAALTSELLSAREELPVELDFVLPDDCPDIAKILRGSFRLGQNAAAYTDGGILAEGSVFADVWYIADTGAVFRVTGRTAFSKKIGCDTGAGARVAPAASGTSTYCNARAVNQRRIECKGAMMLRADYAAPSRQSYMTSCDRGDLELLPETRTFLLPTGQAFARTALDEERPLPGDLPDPAAILRMEGAAAVTDRKQVEGKVMVKGELRITLCLAPSGEGAPFPAQFAAPFSQLIELEGLTETSDCDIRCEMLWCDDELRADESGRKRTAALRGEAMLTVSANQPQELSAVTDAFGLKFRTEPCRTALTLPHRIAAVNGRTPFEWVCDPPVAGASAVLDAWSACSVQPARRTDAGLEIPVRVSVLGLLLDQNERPAFLEKTGEVTVSVPTDAADPVLACVCAAVEGLRLTIEENGVICRGEVAVQGVLYDRVRWEVLEGVELDPDAPLPPAPSPLTMLWAAGDAPLWELAKRYAVPLSALHMQDGFALVERM